MVYTWYIHCIYLVYTQNILYICLVYSKYILRIYHAVYTKNMPGIQLVYQILNGIYIAYTWYIRGISNPYGVLIHMVGIYLVKTSWVCSVPFLKLKYISYNMFIDRIYMVYHRYIIIKEGTEQTQKCFTWYIPAIWMRKPYGWNISCIYHVYSCQSWI